MVRIIVYNFTVFRPAIVYLEENNHVWRGLGKNTLALFKILPSLEKALQLH